MKIKNVNLTVLVLAGLVFLSFAFFVVAEEKFTTQNNVFLDSDQDGLSNEEEKSYGTNPYNSDSDGDGYSDGAEVKSGYNPLKSAPGDKLIQAENTAQVAGVDSENNLTEKMAEKISQITGGEDAENTDLTLEDIQTLIDETMGNSSEEIESLPEIKKEDIKILKQKYSGLSDEEKSEKKKEDFTKYITAVFYIVSSNSPKPITSTNDITSVSVEISQEIMNAISTGDATSLDDLQKSGEKMMEQLKEVEVPEELVDIHIKAMQYALYAKELKKYVSTDGNDPLQDVANFSKIQGFIESLSSFSSNAQEKFAQYGLTYDESVKSILEGYGIDAQASDELYEQLTQ